MEKFGPAAVNIGRQDFDAQTAALADRAGDFFGDTGIAHSTKQ